MENTYYDILGVKQTATVSEIKDAYRHLILIYHPDKNNGDISAGRLSQIINEAYETLKDPNKRNHYDNFLRQNETTRGPFYNTENQTAHQQNYSDRASVNNNSNDNPAKKRSSIGPGVWLVIYFVGGWILSSKFGHASWILIIFCAVLYFLIARANAKENKINH